MPTSPFLKNNSLQILCSVTSGILFFVSTGLHPVAWLSWFSPVPVIFASLWCKPQRSLLPGFIAYFIGGLNLLSYFSRLFPPLLAIALLLITPLLFAIVLWFSTWVHRNSGSAVASVLAFPVAWTSYEFLVSVGSANGTALSWAYYQSAFLPVLQVASITGFSGITFLQAFVASSLAYSLYSIFSGEKISRSLFPAIGAALIFLVVLSFGFLRMREPPNEHTIKAALVSIGVTNKFFDTQNREEAIAVVSSYTGEIDELSSQQISIVVLPEKIAGVTDAYSQEVHQLFSDCARRNHVMIVAGINHTQNDSLFNEAWVFGNNGSQIAVYKKVFMVPGIELGYSTGKSITTIPSAGVEYGIQICKDMDFPAWSQQYGKAHVNVMLIPAWDFTADGYVHACMAVMRGVENGFSELRCAQEGNLTFSDSYGRIVATSTSGETSPAVIIASIPAGNGSTFYGSHGEWFGWLNVMLLTCLSVFTIFRKKKSSMSR